MLKENLYRCNFSYFITVALDALGIGMLLPIGEYLLNEQNDGNPNTYSWKILTKNF